MTNRITVDLNLTGEDRMARGFDKAGDSAKDFGDDLNKTAKDAGFLDKRIGELRGEIDGLIKDFDKSGDASFLKKISAAKRELNQLSGLKPVTVEVETLDKRITEVRRNIGQLALQFSRTGDKGLLGQIAGGKGELSRLTALRKQMFDLGQEGGQHFGEAFTASLRALKGPGIAALVGIAVAATPFLSGVISSAVVGAVGAGGLIGGIALAARDARVQDAGAELGKHAMEAFSRAGEPFIKPVLDAMKTLDPIIDDVAGSLREAFRGVAPVLVQMTQGLGGLVQQMMPGLIATMNNARPVLLVIAAELPKIGYAIGKFFEIISRDPRGAIMAFQDLSRLLQQTIVLTGSFLAVMSKLWATISPVIRAAQGDMIGMAVAVGEMNYALAESNRLGGQLDDGFGNLGNAAAVTKREIALLTDTLERFFGLAMDSEEAAIAFERAWDEMVEGLSQGKRTLDITTEAGRKHREEIMNAVRASFRMHESRVQDGIDAQKSLAIYDQEVEKIRGRARALGYTTEQLDDLLQTARDMPELVAFQVEAPGLELTIEQAKELLRIARELGGSVSLGAIGGIKVGGKRASGGAVLPGQAYLVGEQGPEILMTGSASGRVYSNAQSAAMMSGASGGAAPSVNLNVQVQRTGDRLGDALMQALACELRVTGGVIGGYRIPTVNNPAFAAT